MDHTSERHPPHVAANNGQGSTQSPQSDPSATVEKIPRYLAELQEYAQLYLAARADAIKCRVRRWVLLALGGVVAMGLMAWRLSREVRS